MTILFDLPLSSFCRTEKSVVPFCGRDNDLAVDDRGASGDVPGVVGDLLEAVGPVVAPAGEYLDGLVGQMDLDAVAVELDLVDPARAGRHLLDRRCQRRLDEAREGRFDADRRRLLALEGHNQTKRIGSGSCTSRYRPSWRSVKSCR